MDILLKAFKFYFYRLILKKSKVYEIWENFKIYRHKVTPFGDFGLAYDSGILPNLKRNPFLWFLVPLYFLSQIFKTYRLCKNHEVHLVHSHWMIPCGFSAAFCKKFFLPKLKIILICHGSDSFIMSVYFFKFISKFIINQADDIFVTNYEIQEKIKLLTGKKSLMPAIGINSQKFLEIQSNDSKQHIKEIYNLNGKVILFVGWIIYEKGISYLIESIVPIYKKFPDTKLLVIGNGNLQNDMAILVKSLGLENSVLFLGSISNDIIGKFYQVADIFVLPSFKEGMPVSVMEALLNETYVILSDIAAADLIDSKNEILFRCKVKDTVSISNQLLNLIENFELYQDRLAKGKNLILNNFDNSVIFKNYELVSNNLLKKV